MRSFLFFLVVSVCVGHALPVAAANGDATGQSLASYLDALNDRGQTVIFSSDLVTGDMRLDNVPATIPTLGELQAMLRPFGLTAKHGPANSYLVVTSGEPSGGKPSRAEDPVNAPIPEIVVTSSLHRLDYTRPDTHTYLDRDLVTRIPTTADEAVRMTHRLVVLPSYITQAACRPRKDWRWCEFAQV
jgi:hypothetical protein